MAKLTIEVKGKDYTFELDRAEVKRGDTLGFDRTKMEANLATQSSILWYMGLHKHQPNMTPRIAEELLVEYAENENGDVGEVFVFLTEQYNTFSLATLISSDTKKKGRLED